MRTRKIITTVLSFVVIMGLLLLISFAAPGTSQKKATTLENLQAAYNGESNAHARYLAFAEKADKEGYPGVAALFRAAASAEKIHAANHAEVIKKLGGVAKSEIAKPDVKSTAENLDAAIKGETYEKDVMYPDFIKQARKDKSVEAMRTLTFAKTAEIEHARLYTETLKGLAGMKGAKKNYFVCSVCGYTVAKIDFEKCPSCFNPKDKFQKVS